MGVGKSYPHLHNVIFINFYVYLLKSAYFCIKMNKNGSKVVKLSTYPHKTCDLCT